MTRIKQTQRKSDKCETVKPMEVKAETKVPCKPAKMAQCRYISPANMDVFMAACGFKKLCSFGERGTEPAFLSEEPSNRDLWVRFECTVGEDGQEGAFLWRAKYRGSQPNCNTGNPEYMFNYLECVCPKRGNPWEYAPAMCINQGNERYSLFKK